MDFEIVGEIHHVETFAAGSAIREIARLQAPTMKTSTKRFVVCLKNKGYEVSLEPRKIYQALPDAEAARHRQLRVIDESGEDYLYPASYFTPIEIPQPVRKVVLASA